MSEPARLHPDDLAAIKVNVTSERRAVTSPWMTAAEAAEYLRCPVSRVRKLTMTGELPHEKFSQEAVLELMA